MELYVEFLPSSETKKIALENSATGLDLFEKLDLNPDAWILVRDNEPIPIDTPLRDKDGLKIISVISGG